MGRVFRKVRGRNMPRLRRAMPAGVGILVLVVAGAVYSAPETAGPAAEMPAMQAALKPVAEMLKAKPPAKWLFCGDSITAGGSFTNGARDYTQLFSERVRWELARKPDIVINSAAQGETSRTLVERFDWRVRQFQPNMVFVMVGMNDCAEEAGKPAVPPEEFRANLKKLCALAKEIPSCHVALQTSCPPLRKSSPQRESRYPEYMTIVREVAAESGVALIDHATYWAAFIKLEPTAHPLCMGQGWHPNEYGHRLMAELIFKDLGIFQTSGTNRYRYRTCLFYHP